MEKVIWDICLPIYPIHFSQIVRIILKHAASCVDQFVPELNGLLVSYDKSTLSILTTHDSPTNRQSRCLLVPIRAELPTVFVRAQITVQLFAPKIGSELITTVCTIQPHVVLCKTEVANITVTLPRCSTTGLCPLYNSGATEQEPRNAGVNVNVNDRVYIRLSAVSMQTNLIILRGEPLSVLPDLSTSLVKKFLSSSSDEEAADPIVGNSKKKKSKARSSVGIPVIKSEVSDPPVMCKPEPDKPARKRSTKHLLIKSEEFEEPRVKRQKSNNSERTIISSGLDSNVQMSDNQTISAEDNEFNVDDVSTFPDITLVKERKKSKKHRSEIVTKIEPV